MATCSACNGRGWVTNIDVTHAKSTKKPCKKCKGTGEVGVRNGIWIGEAGGALDLSLYKNGRIVAESKVVLITCGNPAKDGHLVVEIYTMWTAENFRRQGAMTQLLDRMKAMYDGKVKFVLSHWRDSTKEGRACLLARGFKREKDVLLWRRDDVDPED